MRLLGTARRRLFPLPTTRILRISTAGNIARRENIIEEIEYSILKSTMANTDIPDAMARIDARAKDVPWYKPSVGDKLGTPARELLENYSKIPPEEVASHIEKLA